MSIVVPSAFALAAASDPDADLPIIGYDSLATTTTLTTTYANTAYPATNLCNTATNLLWKSGSVLDQYITVLFGASNTVDYIAIARHNWGSGAVQVTVQGLPVGGDPDTPADWDELVAANVPASDSRRLYRFTPQSLIGIRLKLEPGTVEPQAAVLYTGALLVFQRGLQPGHVPVTQARQRNVVSPRSQAGEYLGTVILGSSLSTSVDINNLTPAWVRSTLDDWLSVCRDKPFFFAWRPQTYPEEVGYAWLTNDPMPVISHMSGFVNLSLQLEALAL